MNLSWIPTSQAASLHPKLFLFFFFFFNVSLHFFYLFFCSYSGCPLCCPHEDLPAPPRHTYCTASVLLCLTRRSPCIIQYIPMLLFIALGGQKQRWEAATERGEKKNKVNGESSQFSLEPRCKSTQTVVARKQQPSGRRASPKKGDTVCQGQARSRCFPTQHV